MRKPCLKQKVFCRIVREDGRTYEAFNTCDVGEECNRILAGCQTGEGYELCLSQHAEANCAVLAKESANVPGVAYIYGHTWICKECQDVLSAINVKTFHLGGMEIPDNV